MYCNTKFPSHTQAPLFQLLFLFLFFLLLFTSCGQKEFGHKLQIMTYTSVSQLKQYPQNYLNQMVKIKGRVVDESEKKLWITLQDDHRNIMVDVGDDLFPLPSLLNKRIIVIGPFLKTKEGYMLKSLYIKII